MHEVIIRPASARTVCTVGAFGTFSGQAFSRKLPVIGEIVRILPDLPQGLLPDIALDEALVIHRLAAADISNAVNADGTDPRQTSPESPHSPGSKEPARS